MDRVFSVSACLAFLGLAVLVLFFTGGAGATNDPPPSGGPVTGDWTVTDTRAYNGVSITLSGTSSWRTAASSCWTAPGW